MGEFRKASLSGKTDPTVAVAGLVAELAVPKVGKALCLSASLVLMAI